MNSELTPSLLSDEVSSSSSSSISTTAGSPSQSVVTELTAASPFSESTPAINLTGAAVMEQSTENQGSSSKSEPVGEVTFQSPLVHHQF